MCGRYTLVGREDRAISPLYYYSTPDKLPRDRQTSALLLSMGKADLYPFVIPDPVLDKLEFIASLRPGRKAPRSLGAGG